MIVSSGRLSQGWPRAIVRRTARSSLLSGRGMGGLRGQGYAGTLAHAHARGNFGAALGILCAALVPRTPMTASNAPARAADLLREKAQRLRDSARGKPD